MPDSESSVAQVETLEAFLVKSLPISSVCVMPTSEDILSLVTAELFETDENFCLTPSETVADETIAKFIGRHFESQGFEATIDPNFMGMYWLERSDKRVGWVGVSNYSYYMHLDPVILVTVSMRWL